MKHPNNPLAHELQPVRDRATTSAMLAIVSMGAGWPVAIAAVLVGMIALIRIHLSNGAFRGTGVAITGLLSGALFSAMEWIDPHQPGHRQACQRTNGRSLE